MTQENNKAHPNTRLWTIDERVAYFEKCKPQLRLMCAKCAIDLRDPSIDTDDLLQEVSVILFRCYDSYDPEKPANFSTYVYKAVRNALVSKVREVSSQKRKVARNQTPYETGKRPSSDDDVMGADNLPLENYLEGGNDMEEEILKREKFERLMEVLRESLPEAYYEPLLDYLLYHNKTQKEIAQEIGKSQAMVSHLLTDLSIIVFYLLSRDPLFEEDLRSRTRRPKGGKRNGPKRKGPGNQSPGDRTSDQ